MIKLLHLTGFRVGIILTLLSLLIYKVNTPFLDMIEDRAYDLHFTTRGATEPGPDVAIAVVDEKSIDALGRWPWPRSRMAELVTKLDSLGAKVVAFDIVFSEADNTSRHKYYNEISKELEKKGFAVGAEVKKLSSKLDNDVNFASVIEESPSVILGYYFYTSKDQIQHRGVQESSGEPINASRITLVRSLDGTTFTTKTLSGVDVEDNIPLINNAASNFGHFNLKPDPDGTIRRVPLILWYDGYYYPHMSLESVRKFTGSAPIIINLDGHGVESIKIGGDYVESNERGMSFINYRGPKKTFPHYSISDILDGKITSDQIKDKIILVGATAIGIYDLRVTPFQEAFPGVEINATVIDNIIAGDFIFRPDWVMIFDIFAMIFLGLLMSLIIPRIGALIMATFTLVVSVGFIFLNHYFFTSMNIWLSIVYPLFTLLLVAFGTTIFQFMTEERKKREIRNAFSLYVSPSLVNIIVKDPEILSLGGEEKRLTVLFSDIRGFTSVSEGLDPQSLVRLMNDYLTPMTDLVFDNEGTVDKYMGDAVMAFWGAPVDMEDHAEKASKTALDMMKTLAELQPKLREHGVDGIDIGIGLSTGLVTVGNMGSSTRFDYTVIGDSINLGSRLEGLNKEYGTHILVTKYTYLDIKDKFVLREIDKVKVKGKEISIAIFELMGNNEELPKLKPIKDSFEAGLKCYRRQDWTRAEKYFNECLEISPDDGPAKVFLSRVKSLKHQQLPEKWDGVYVMTKK